VGTHRARALAAVLLTAAFATAAEEPAGRFSSVSEAQRLALLRRAQVWRRTDVPSMDLRAGPPGGFAPGQDVTCDYVVPEKKLTGSTRKFECALAPGDVVKVKYGDDNGEVYATVAASRLFWGLGFGTDAFYQVRLTCRSCPRDPWNAPEPRLPTVVFEHATIERKTPGEEIAHKEGEGWGWDELARVDPAQGGAPAEQIQALTLLAVFVQHTDNKAIQQRFICLRGGENKEDDDSCATPFLVQHDLGATFGRGGLIGAPTTGSANFREWSSVRYWESPESCRTHLGGNITRHTLKDPVISEAGRRFLAGLLAQLTDAQIRGMFEAARIDGRQWHEAKDALRNGTVDQWVAAFKAHRDEITQHTCPR